MMVSVETVGGLERRMKVQVPAERIEKEVDSRLQRVGKTAKIKGFRPGKVPMKVIRQRYGGQVRQEVLGEVMQMSYFEAISQEKLRPAGHPRIEPGNTGQGEDLEYVATFEVYPEVALQGHEGLAVEKPVAEIGESDIDDMIDNLRRQRADWEEVDAAAESGHRVIVNFEGKIDGEAFPGGSGEDVPVVLGQGGMLPDFENGLIGMRAGDEKDITVTFPDDYGAENLAGRTADFHVTARRVETQKLPEIDDDFCAAFGIGEGGVAKLREEVLDSMRRELEQTVQSRLKEQIMQGLLDRNEVELPGSLVDDEIRSLREAAARRMGVDPSDPNNLPPRESFEAVAQRRVKLGLLVAEVIRQAGIELDKERVRERVRRLAADYRDPEEVVKLYTGNRQLMDQLEMEVMEEQVVDWLIERAEISEKDIGFKELMRPE
ncbi:MAG: trigger factor [Gammaproteobacteria bacterium SG8_31]|jgi:trigger factor|nr:MAG: trigger factor [Gammaproteobacteria bacterium SG8_31]